MIRQVEYRDRDSKTAVSESGLRCSRTMNVSGERLDLAFLSRFRAPCGLLAVPFPRVCHRLRVYVMPVVPSPRHLLEEGRSTASRVRALHRDASSLSALGERLGPYARNTGSPVHWEAQKMAREFGWGPAFGSAGSIKRPSTRHATLPDAVTARFLTPADPASRSSAAIQPPPSFPRVPAEDLRRTRPQQSPRRNGRRERQPSRPARSP
jgi:hypothetical protein